MRSAAPGRARPLFERSGVADERTAAAHIVSREKRRERHIDEARIAVKDFAVRIGELHAFDERMHEGIAGRIKRGNIEAVEQRQALQERRSLPPRRGLVHAQPAISK
jgi:hypothetical protein